MANGEHKGPGGGAPPLLDSVVRFLVWSGVIASVVAPLIAIFMISQMSFFAPWGWGREPRFEELHRIIVATRAWFGGVVSGGSTRSLIADSKRLREMTAFNGEATAARTLEIIVVRFSDTSAQPAKAGRLPQRAGYRSVNLDITSADRTAALIIADAPVLWTVQANAPGQRARVAFEGAAPFDIANGYPGLLAGFRIESFGASNTTRPLDILESASPGARRYCAALALWSAHFGVKPFDTSATFVENPTSIRVTSGGVAHDGRDLGGRSPYYACEKKLR
jgi:hypothetical protein